MAFIDEALDDLKSLDKEATNIFFRSPWIEYADLHHSILYQLVPKLRNLRTFVLCVRKLGNDTHLRSGECDDSNNSQEASLGSLLESIEEAVSGHAQEIQCFCACLDIILPDHVPDHLIEHFTDDINNFEEEIEEWYITLQQSISSSIAGDEVIAITDSVLENLVDVLSIFWQTEKVLVIESLIEKIKFLKNFIRFAMVRSADHRQLEDMLKALAVNAAHLCFKVPYQNDAEDKEWLEEMRSQISVLLQKIKPNDHHAYDTYTQALTSSKLSRKLHAPISDRDDDPLMIMKDFIYSLVSDLWEMLQLDTSPVVSVKDQLQVLLEGLRSLRTVLVKQPNKFNEKNTDFLGVLICDAGLVIFSLHQEDVKADVELLGLLGRIEHIQKEVEGRDPEESTFKFSRTNGLGFVDHLIEYLEDVAITKAGSKAQSCAQTVKEELVFLRSVLVKIVDLHSEQEELHALWNRILQVADRVEFLIDLLVVGDASNSFPVLFDSIIEDISTIKTDASNITPGKIQDIKVSKVTKKSNHVSSQSSAPKDDEIVGFDEESTSITDRLTRGSSHLKIIAIVGMGGQGKTTLASKIYNDPEVTLHFHVRALCSISQVFDRRKVLLELLSHIVTKLHYGPSEKTEQDLAEELRRHLKGNRYLIFLDDVWDIQVWYSLAESLPDDSNGSRIMLTSRLGDVAPPAMLDNDGPHALRQLTNEESLELLQRKLFHGNGCPPELHESGMQIAEKCKGLPLTIVVVAGLLANTEQEKWNEILESLRSGIISSTAQWMTTAELSYKHLPYYLKPCFLYFAMFPEDQEISAKKLIRLWIAEGFVQKTKLKGTEVLEDVATDYLEDLVNRSLVQVSQRRSIGGVKACRVHDLLHDFCRTKAKEENFSQLLRGYDELLGFNALGNLRRLGIQSERRHFKEAGLFCPRVRSLQFFRYTEKSPNTIHSQFLVCDDLSSVIRIFKLAKVLDVMEFNLVRVFPSEIGLLVQLRYLAVEGKIETVPSSIGNLSFLETFILNSQSNVVLFPDTLWNLRKLRHIWVRSHYHDGFRFAIENLEYSPDLYELESCASVIIFCWGSMEKHLKKFPNVRKLKCKLFQEWDTNAENCSIIVVPDFLRRLESLRLSLSDRKYSLEKRIDFEFCLPANLKKLTLSDFGLPWSKISSIGKLPNLEVLKLFEGSFSGEIWDMEEGEFSSLKFLKLSALEIVKWTACDDQFPRLQKLVVERCSQLEEIPSYTLGNTPALEMIQLSPPYHHSLTSSVKQIQEEQMNLGNSDLKIFLVPTRKYNAFYESDSDCDGDDYGMAEALEMLSLSVENE